MAADDERPGAGADPRTLALSDRVFAIAMTLLVLSTPASSGPAQSIR